MEGIEEANKAAIENCYNVLKFITQPQEKKYDFRYLAVETEKAVSKFKKVVSNLGNGVGHARARILKQNRTSPLLQGAFLETRNDPKVEQKQPVNQGFQLFKTDLNEGCVHENGSTTGKSCLSLGNSSLELSLSCGKTPVSVGHHPKSNTHYHFLQQQQQMKYQAELMHKRGNIGVNMKFDNPSYTPTVSSTRSFISSLSVDGNVANLGGDGFNLIGAGHASGQNSSQCKKKCTAVGDKSLRCRITGKCHCPKKRKNRVRRSIKVPAVSNKLADIPSDEFSWRKYGQKPIKGSPHPRGYYKCSSVRGCPARKHVERCLDEPSMLIVTYEDEHNHPLVPLQSVPLQSTNP